MARIRSIKPEFFKSTAIADLAIPTRLLFVGLWTHADDDGRELDEVRLIKAAIYPLDDRITIKEIDWMMTELADCGRIVRYRSDDGKALFQIVGWEHQKIDRKTPSKYAPPARALDASSANGHR